MKKLSLIIFISTILFSLEIKAQEKDSTYYFNLGMKYMMESEEYFLNDPDSCIIITQLAADQFEKAQNWYYYVLTIGGIGGVYAAKGDNVNSLKYLDKSLQESRDKLGEVMYLVLSNYGNYYRDIGQYDLSLEYLYKALEKYKEKNDNPFSESLILQTIGLNFKVKGDLEKAIQFFSQAYQIKEELGMSQHYYAIENRISLAECYGLNEEFNKQKDLLLILEKDLLEKAEIRNTLVDINLIHIYTQVAEIYFKQNQIDQSQIYLQKALSIQEDDLSLGKSFSYSLLGQIAQKQNDLAKAIQYFKESKRIALIQNETFPYHQEVAEPDLLLAKTYLQQKDYALAIDHYKKALLGLCPDVETLEGLANPYPSAFTNPKMGLQILKSKAEALQIIAKAENNESYYDEAINTYLATAKCVDEIRKSYNSEKAKQLLGGDVLDVFEAAIALAFERYQTTNNTKYLEQAFTFAEKNKANLILESLQEENALGQGTLPDSLLKKENSLQIDISYYKRKIQEGERNEKTKANMLSLWKSNLLELEQQYDALQLQLEKNFPKYFQLKYDYPELSLADFQKQLPDSKTLILEYFIGEQEQFLFAISKNELKVYPLGLDTSFKKNIQNINQILSSPPTSQNFPTHLKQFASFSQNLYQQLIPFAIDPSINKLLIIPDDVLHYLPFEILCQNVKENAKSFAPNNFNYLLNDYDIYAAYSLTLWQQSLQKKPKQASKKWIGFAPSFKSGNSFAQRACDMNELYDLSCSKEEVGQIQTFFGGDIFLGKEANKENFQQLANDYQIIHLATHACIDNQDGDLNRIFLVDDFLNNNDLSNYQLNADLAVLSACNTGSGEILKGEGIFSISRGFIMAGVPSTLTTLWSVDDCTTSSLMQSFYQYLDNGKTKAAALRQAKLDHLDNAEIINTHPYFWAAFIQSGNPNAIKDSGLGSWWMVGGVIVVLLAGIVLGRNAWNQKRPT